MKETENLTIITLLKIWQELPALAGEHWPELEDQLTALLDAFTATTDTGEQAQISNEIEQVLETVPALIDRFDDEFKQINQLKGIQSRGTPGRNPTISSSQIRNFLWRRSQPKPTLTRFTDISCPRRVWIKTPRISVVVRLNQKPSIFSVSEQLQVDQETSVFVQINALGFEVLGPTIQEILIKSDAESAPLVFDLTPRQIARTSVSFDFIQADNPIGTASVQVEITEEEVSIQNQAYTETSLHLSEDITAPDFILYITYEPLLSPPRLCFRLHQRGNITEQEFEQVLQDDLNSPQKYAEHIYRRLTDLTSGIDPTAHVTLKKRNVLGADMLNELLKEEGQNLWKKLIPSEFQERYKREREQWQDKSLLILSDEPHIPWELLWPYGPWEDDGPLCLHMNLSRWLRRSAQGQALDHSNHTLRMQKLALIVPSDSQLPAASMEHSFMSALMKQHGLQDVSPAEPTYLAVKKFLQEDSYNWVHIATHGSFYSADPDGESAIWLKDQRPLTPRSIVGEVERAIQIQRPAFFFNACEVGRQGLTITGIGGWASSLIGAGAGFFLAPLWTVNDIAALKFSTVVYQALLEGKTAAEAVRQARLETRRDGDPTWLSYSLYAHPNAYYVL